MDKNIVLSKVKMLLPNDNNNPNYDAIIGYVVDKTCQNAANYTHVPVNELSDDIDYTVIDMCIDLITSADMLTPISEQDKGISSVTEGDEAVTFKSIGEDIAAINTANPITKDYRSQLNRFRRLNFD